MSKQLKSPASISIPLKTLVVPLSEEKSAYIVGQCVRYSYRQRSNTKHCSKMILSFIFVISLPTLPHHPSCPLDCYSSRPPILKSRISCRTPYTHYEHTFSGRHSHRRLARLARNCTYDNTLVAHSFPTQCVGATKLTAKKVLSSLCKLASAKLNVVMKVPDV